MAENSKQKYNNFLREEVNKYCNENGCYEIYFDYRDEISPKYLLEVFENYQNDKKNYIKFKSYLTEKIYEDYYYDYDYSLYDTIHEDIYRTNDRDIIDEYLATEDFYEDLTSAGYKGINFDIKDLLRNSRLCVNVMFGTDKERNFDMGSIVSSYGNDYQTPFEDWSVNEVYGLNGSCWKDSLSYTDKAPEFVQEDINKTLSEFEKMLEKEELEQER